MSTSILFMSMSLDGYIAAEDDFLGGPEGKRLHEWFAPGGEFAEVTGPAREVIDEMGTAGAVVTGRRTAELMDHWGGDLMGGVPIFVPSHRPPATGGAPVLLGRGRRLFDELPQEIELEIVRVIDTPEATHIRYRVHCSRTLGEA